MGTEVRDEAMRTYFKNWAFTPRPQRLQAGDGTRLGFGLDWYFQYMMHTIDAVDYAVESVVNDDGTVTVEMSRRGNMPGKMSR